jgi:hypothetical protein
LQRFKNEIMKSTFKVIFYLKRNTIRKDGKMPIVARITVDGHVAQFNTKLEIQPDNWSVKMGKAIGQSSDSKKLNALLNEINASIHMNYYEVTRKHLQKFIQLKYYITDISLKEIKNIFICDFEIYLLTTAGCNANTTAKFMQFFKRIIIIARDNGLIAIDPFANYKIRWIEVTSHKRMLRRY